LTLDDCREYWESKRTPEEKRALEETLRRAKLGLNPRLEPVTVAAAAFAIAHQYERNSVVRTTDLEVTAMERMMGRGRPEDVLPELKRQGVLIKDGQATTEKVWAQERRITAFARETRGSMAPLGVNGQQPDLTGMTHDQKNATRHVWDSRDQVVLIRGGAGTGKTTAMRTAIAGTGKPVVVLAPSSDASRSELREQGFKDADTVAAFLGNEERQEQARGGVIWCDEAGMLAIDDLEALCTVCKNLGAKLVLQGDPLQHKSVARHGNMLNVLHDFAGLPVAELKEIKRRNGSQVGGAPQATGPADWSIVSGSGETRPAHVGLHGSNNLQKPIHGVFYGDPVAVTNEAWTIAQQQGIRPITANGVDIYVVPRPNSGWAGGYTGQGQNINTVTIITRPGTNQIITAYPGNGTPLPRP
jgi:hypothetical protein